MDIDTSCKGCKSPMPERLAKSRTAFTITGYLCERCGHWNNLKRRKAKQIGATDEKKTEELSESVSAAIR